MLMMINLNPQELQTITSQLTDALLGHLKTLDSRASKAAGEALRCLSVEDVAKRLGCCQKTVLKWIREGRLGAANTSDNIKRPQYLVSEADLASFYKAHRIGR